MQEIRENADKVVQFLFLSQESLHFILGRKVGETRYHPCVFVDTRLGINWIGSQGGVLQRAAKCFDLRIGLVSASREDGRTRSWHRLSPLLHSLLRVIKNDCNSGIANLFIWVAHLGFWENGMGGRHKMAALGICCITKWMLWIQGIMQSGCHV